MRRLMTDGIQIPIRAERFRSPMTLEEFKLHRGINAGCEWTKTLANDRFLVDDVAAISLDLRVLP